MDNLLGPLLVNASLLLAMVVVYDLLFFSRNWQSSPARSLVLGFGVGAICIAVMSAHWQMLPGLIFDTRSVLLGVAGLFFGNVATLTAILVASVFRWVQGGIGTTVGIGVIITSGLVGIAFRRFHRDSLATIGWGKLFLLGILVHLGMLAWMLLLPTEMARETLALVSLPVLTIYPLATVAVGTLMRNRVAWYQTVLRLREQNLYNTLLFSETPLPQIVLEHDSRVIRDCNKAAIRAFGVENREQLTGRSLSEFAVDENSIGIDVLLNHPPDSLADLDAGLQTLHLRRANGERWDALPWVAPFKHESRDLLHLGVVDITETLRTREALRQSDERLRRAITNAPIPIILHAEGGEIVAISDVWCEISGYPREDLRTVRDWTQRAYPDGNPSIIERIRRLYTLEERVEEGDIPIIIRDGSVRTWQFSSAPAGTMPDGRRLVISTAIDVSERRSMEHHVQALNTQLESRVRDRTAQLQAANEELEAFAYSVSHDLRAPLRSLGGFSQLLAQNYGNILDVQGVHYLGRIAANAGKMSDLIDDLLQLSRVTRRPVELQLVNLSELARESFRSLQAEEPDAVAEIEIQPGLAAMADAGLLRIVLDNLLGNAWKFSAPREVRRIQIGAAEKEGATVYFVRDFGVGFDMSHAESLFLPFRRLHRTEEFPGTGIGLATVHRIVQRHGGRIWAEANLGQGATFFFTLGEHVS